jgi:hypothetical protein
MSENRTRWELRNIAMMYWYLFAQDIPVRGHVAVCGSNGAGKSAIIDGIQTVLTGNPGNIRFNRFLQEKQQTGVLRRTVRDYCLGMIDDADDGVSAARDSAITYVMLGFRHSDGREATVGLCLTARANTDEVGTEARFIVEGKMLSVRDVAAFGSDDQGEYSESLPWAAVIRRLREDADVEIKTYNGVELFQRGICEVLGPDNGFINPQKFVRNLKNSISFRPVDTATNFVRQYILDPVPLRLADMRASIARYKQIQEKVLAVKRQAEDVDGLVRRAKNTRNRRLWYVGHQLTLRRHDCHVAAQAAVDTRREAVEARDKIAAAEARLPEAQLAHEQARADTSERARLVAESDTARGIDAAKKEINIRGGALESWRGQLAPKAALLRFAAASAPIVAAYNKGLSDEIAGWSGALGDDASAAAALVKIISGNAPAAARAAADAAERQARAAAADVEEAERAAAAIEENIRRVQSGQRIISHDTQVLMAALLERGIDAVPLCDLVTEVEPRWQRAVETVLGSVREALIVDPGDYAAALAVHRSMRKEAGDASIVNTTKTGQTKPPKPRSLATAVTVGHPHARAFLDYRLGGVIMAGDDGDLSREESAITDDLHYLSGRVAKLCQPPRFLVLGALRGEETVRRLEEDLEDTRAGLARHRERSAQKEQARKVLERIAQGFAEVDAEAVGRAVSAAAEAAAAIARQEAVIADLESRGDDGLTEALETARKKEDAALSALQALIGDISFLRGDIKRLEEKERADVSADAEARARAKDVLGLAAKLGVVSADEANDIEFDLGETVPPMPDLSKVKFDEEEKAAYAANNKGSLADGGVAARLGQVDWLEKYNRDRYFRECRSFPHLVGSEYVNRYGIGRQDFMDLEGTIPDDDWFETAEAWCAAESRRLQDNVLKDYEDQARKSYEEAVSHFKNDFVGKMRGAFDGIRGQIDEMNRQLSKREFHGLVYRFDRRPAASYRDMIALVEASSDPGFDFPLLGAVADVDEHVARAVKKLEEFAFDPAADISDLEDPRRYFEFELSMYKDGKLVTSLSRRQGTGSTGQVQISYYVAIAAALAASYYPDHRSLDGGLALAVLDEAFDKMDSAVIGQTIGYMTDIGLQTFIAAPDKERTTFIQFADTMIHLSRSQFAIDVDIQYVKEHTRAQFQDENPSLYGFEEFKARKTEAAAVDVSEPGAY